MVDFQNVTAMIIAFFFSAKLDIIVALVIIDVVLAVAAALRQQTFDLRRLGDFLTTMILPYVLVYLVLTITVGLVPALNGVLGQGLDLLVFGVIVASLLAAIYENLKSIGLNLPGSVAMRNAVARNENPEDK